MLYTHNLAHVLALLCGFAFCSAQQGTQTNVEVSKISSDFALSALKSNGDAQQAKLDSKLGREGIVIYRVVVNSDGNILQKEVISGDSDLQALADPFVSGWHFRKVNIRGSASAWFSFLGVCFFRDIDVLVPCYLPQAQPPDQASDTLPARLSLVGTAIDNHYNFPPLHKKKGDRLERPPLARQIRATGQVVVDVVIAPDGRVSSAAGIEGQPISLLLAPTIQALRGWRFEPVTFLGKPVEVQLRFSVLYGPHD